MHSIILSETELRQLRPLITAPQRSNAAFPESVRRLQDEMAHATIVPDADLPRDVVALESTVELDDLHDGERMTFTLVMPDHADIAEGRISVLAPLGMALLGYRVGDEIEWPVPAGTARVRIRRILDRSSTAEDASVGQS